ncbi:MAG: Stp1/IreP family PP2C-type Ser/Thr phosphatase [Oscillospiraceae bacterium]
MKIAACTDLGCKHTENQDFYRAGRLSDDTYWIVLCDGMGGVTDGGKASRMSGEYLQKEIQKHVVDLLTPESVREFILDCVKRCNRYIYTFSHDGGKAVTMGTTVVLAIVRDNLVQIAHAGDSRAYLIQKAYIKQLTKDHSIVQELLDSGKITAAQASTHPNKNIITSALGVDTDTQIDYDEHKFSKGDTLLLCSDGLSNMVSEQRLLEIVNEYDFYRVADKMVKVAVEAGGYDNITAVVLGA